MSRPSLPSRLGPLPVRPPRPEDFTSRLRSPAVAARIGLALGVAFGVCFLTGLLSHYAQQPSQPVPFPSSPSWGYRLTQGVHVTTGIAAVPLLLVKLWTVYPRLFAPVPKGRVRALVLAALERGSIAVLVAAAIFQLVSGLTNAAQWYPWGFGFRASHYAIAYVAVGALLVHIAVKLPIIRDVLTHDVEDGVRDRPTTAPADAGGVLTRRGLLRTTWLATGAVVLLTAGQTLPLLRRVSVFGTRSGDGPGGVPINVSASEAGVTAAATRADWRLVVRCGDRRVELSRDDLLAMPQRTETLPIACVEGWSANGTWSGVRVSDLLALVEAPAERDVTFTSLQDAAATYAVTVLQPGFAADDRSLVALMLDGAPLAIDHGFPCRLIAPNRPGVLQTKWLSRIEVAA